MATALCENPDSSIQRSRTRKQSFGSAVVRSRARLTVWLSRIWISPIHPARGWSESYWATADLRHRVRATATAVWSSAFGTACPC